MEKADIKSWDQKELGEFLVSLGEKPFRAKQLYPWLHIKHAVSFEDMTDISKKLKEKLINSCHLTVLRQVDMQQSKLDGTRKYRLAGRESGRKRPYALQPWEQRLRFLPGGLPDGL